MSKLKICIDAGHSYGLNGKGTDPGAVNNELGIKESIIATEIALYLGKILEEVGHTIIYTRTNGSDDITLKKRCDIANSNKCDLFVSIHLNSFDNPNSNGIETLVYNLDSTAGRYAKNVQNELIKASKATNRGVKERKDLYVLKHTSMPAMLIETGFISNREEGMKLNDPPYQRLLCEAIKQGIMNT